MLVGTSNASALSTLAIALGALWSGLGPLEMDFRVIVNTPSAANNFVFLCGLSDAAQSNLVAFKVNWTSSAVLFGQTSAAGISSSTSTVAFPSSTFMRLRIVVNAAWNSVSFYLNGTLVGAALTTNIPTGVAIFPVISITNTAGSTAQSFYPDQFYLSYLYTV